MRTIMERRQYVANRLNAARKVHKSVADLERQFIILTAARLAEKIQLERAEKLAGEVMIPQDRPCFEANPALWDQFLRIRGLDYYTSDLWTEADVVKYIDCLKMDEKN